MGRWWRAGGGRPGPPTRAIGRADSGPRRWPTPTWCAGCRLTASPSRPSDRRRCCAQRAAKHALQRFYRLFSAAVVWFGSSSAAPKVSARGSAGAVVIRTSAGRLGCPSVIRRSGPRCAGCCCRTARRRPGRALPTRSAAWGTGASGCSGRRVPAACCGSGVSRRSSLSSQTAFLAAATLRFEQTQSRVEHPFFGAAVPLKLGVDQVHRAEAVAAGGWACAGANGRAGRLAGEAVAGGRRTLRRGRGTCPRPGRRPTSAPAGRCGGFGRRIRAAGRAAAVVGGRRRSTSSTRVSCQPSFRPPKSCFWRRSSPVVQSSL